MRKRILEYFQMSLLGIGVASLGTFNIFEPKIETLIYGGSSLMLGLLFTLINWEK